MLSKHMQESLQRSTPVGPKRIQQWMVRVEKLEDRSNKLQCLEEAGIDNTEAYSQGMSIYYDRYPEKDDYAD